MLDALNLKPEVFGLDISDFSLKIAKLQKKGSSFVLASCAQSSVSPGLISDGEIKNAASLTEVLRRAVKGVKNEKLNTDYVIASLPEEKSFLQIIRLPKMKEEEVRRAVYFEAENYIPLPISEVYLDFQIVPPLYGQIDHTDFLIAALPKKTVDPYIECLRGAGLRPLALEIESQALVRALVKNEVYPSPLLIIDFGGTRTSFIIFSGRSLKFTTSIRVSSQDFTEAIATNMKVTNQEAEKLKVQFGLEKDKKSQKEKGELFECLIPCLSDLTEQIKKYINYYKSHSSHDHLAPENKEIKKILISGGGSNLKGLADFLSQELKITVEKGNPWVNILSEKEKKSFPLPEGKELGFATALGLALRGAKYDL
jgi:type IV pilus assembly protein PilM